MIFNSRSKKSWRYFPKKNRTTDTIRKICLAALVLEAALIIRDFQAAQVHVAEEEVYERVFMGDEAETVFEEYFGFHIRVRNGMVELYRYVSEGSGN